MSGGPLLHFRRVFSPISETFVYAPIVALAAAGEPQAVLCLLRTNRTRRPFPARYLIPLRDQATGPRNPEAGKVPGWLWEAERPLWPLLRRWLAYHLQRLRPAVIFAHFGPDGCLVAPIAARLRIPLVTVFYGYDVSRLLVGPSSWPRHYRTLFRRGTLLCGISRHVIARLEGLGAPADRCRLLRLGVDLERFRQVDPLGAFDGRTVRLLHVGRLTAKKNPVKLIEAFAIARERLHPALDLQLTIVGSGVLEPACRVAIDRHGLTDVVAMPGRIEHQAVAELFTTHHIYAQFCETAPDGDMEGLGVTFVEASARGLPIVGTRHDGIPDVVRHGETGLLAPEGDVRAFAEHLVTLARDPATWPRFGSAARRHVEAHYALPGQLARIRELRDEAVALGPGRP